MLKHTSETRAKQSLDMKCKECMHFSTGPAYYEKPCKDMGIKAGAPACPAYTPDVIQLRDLGEDALSKIKEIITNANSSQTKIVAMFLARPDWFKKAELTFMQEVVFCFGQNYLCNYARGYVVGTTKDGSTVYLSSTLEKLNKGKPAHASVLRSSVKTLEEFKKIKADLIKQDRVIEPTRTGTKVSTFQRLTMSKKELAAYFKLLNQNPDDYNPPTLDSVPDSWRDNRTLKKMDDPLKASKKVARGDKSSSGKRSVKIKR